MNFVKNTRCPEISIVMPVYNAEEYIQESMDSIINQSFEDFECLIIDDGSTDGTRDIIRSYDDPRIRLIEKSHDFIASQNAGLNQARGKYLARMDADDIMYPDRLRIQHSIMKDCSSITVCGTWVNVFGDKVPGKAFGIGDGIIEYPLLMFLKGCFVAHPSTMIRSDFLRKYHLQYERDYLFAEDFKLLVEIAKHKGTFYVESQPLLHYRLSDGQLSKQRRKEQKTISKRILQELLVFLFEKNRASYPEFSEIYKQLLRLQEKSILDIEVISRMTYDVLQNNKNRLILA